MESDADDAWNSAAAQLIAITVLPQEVGEGVFLMKVREWEGEPHSDLRRRLERSVGRRVRARRVLLGEIGGKADEYRWVRGEIELEQAFMRGGDHVDGVGDRVWTLHRAFRESHGQRWRVSEAAKAMAEIHESEWDDSLRGYMDFDYAEVPAFRRTIHTHYEEGDMLTIGDGYHRAVAAFRAGFSKVPSWIGRPGT